MSAWSLAVGAAARCRKVKLTHYPKVSRLPSANAYVNVRSSPIRPRCAGIGICPGIGPIGSSSSPRTRPICCRARDSPLRQRCAERPESAHLASRTTRWRTRSPSPVARICDDKLIAAYLNRNGILTARGNRWNHTAVTSVRTYRGIPVYCPQTQQAEEWMKLTAAAAYLGVSSKTLRLEVVEAALAHVVQNKVEAAYARSDLFERRRRGRRVADWRILSSGSLIPDTKPYRGYSAG